MLKIIDPDSSIEIEDSEEFLGFNSTKDRANIIICAQTRGGKTTFLQNLLFKSLLSKI